MEHSLAVEVAVELALILAILILNGLFSMAELAVVSARRARLQKDAEQGDARAQTVLHLIEEPTVFLSTVQLGVTLLGIIAGAVGGSTLAESLGAGLERLGVGIFAAQQSGFFITVIGITLCSVVIGELVPKRIALAYPEEIAKVAGPVMKTLSRLISPLVMLLERSTSLLVRVLPTPPPEQGQVTEEEIQFMIDQGSELGVIEKAEGNIVGKVLRLGDRPASSLMTPRNDLQWIDVSEPVESIWKQVSESPHSYFPVADGSIENLLGILAAKDLARYLIEGSAEGIQSILIEPLRISSMATALQVIEQFKSSRRNIAVVLDEHSGIDGMITTHDIAEAIIGDLADTEGEGPEVVRRPDGSFLIDAGMEINDLFALLELDERVQYQDEGYHSVGGFVCQQLNHIPATGERFEYGGYLFEVVDLDRHRVDKVLVAKLPPSPASPKE